MTNSYVARVDRRNTNFSPVRWHFRLLGATDNKRADNFMRLMVFYPIFGTENRVEKEPRIRCRYYGGSTVSVKLNALKHYRN